MTTSSTTKKRPLPQQQQHKLGAGEFATILNGDDARQILTALKKFTKTVKRERRQALYADGDDDPMDHDDDDDEDDDDDDDDSDDSVNDDKAQTGDIVETSVKKLKEDWMEDSKDYKVPFVGTSIAKGDTGRVVVGRWPTGLLEAYMRQSPLAVELVSDNLIPPAGYIHKRLLKQKKGKTSYQLYKAYLQALAELLTAAVPVSRLRRDYGMYDEGMDDVSKEQPKFMADFMKDRYPDLIQLLNSETGSGRGKAGSIAGIGQLATLVLQILARLASSSLGISRQIVRTLDASVRDGVLKVLLREPRKTLPSANANSDGLKEVDDKKLSDRLAVPYKTRANCIRLAITLLQIQDQSVTSYISTMGNKERKNNPGILYLALRYGFEDSMFRERTDISKAQRAYLESLSVLLRSIAVLFQADKHGLLSRRSLADLLGAEALLNVCQAAICAPPLTSYEAVLNLDDTYDDELTALEDVGCEARRLVFPLLANKAISPFLNRISGKEDDKLSSIYMTFIVKALNQLFNANTSIQTQNFIIHSMTETPLLLAGFFRIVKIPDVKSTFTFISMLHFIARVVKEGPPPLACIAARDMSLRGIEDMISVVLPHHVNRNLLSRAIQNPNVLVVAEAAKLIMRALARFKLLLLNVEESGHRELLSRTFTTRLPDVQALLSTRAKFDPFNNKQRAFVFVNGLLCRMLEDLAETLPVAILSTKFDWIKLLPDVPSLFGDAEPAAQLRILQTFEKVMTCRVMSADETSRPTPKACRSLLEFTLHTNHVKVHSRLRRITNDMLLRLVDCPKELTEASYCLKYEISLWVDAMDHSLLNEFHGLLDDIVKNSFRHKLTRIQAWKEANLLSAIPEFHFSLILTIGWSRLDNLSGAFARLVCEIASRCLLFHANPVPLAAMIMNVNTKHGEQTSEIALALQEYSKGILDACKAPYDYAHSLELACQAEKLSEMIACVAGRPEDMKPFCIGNDATTCSKDVLYLRRCLQTIALTDGFEISEVTKEWIDKANSSIRTFILRCDFEPLLMVLGHPATIRGHLPKRTKGLLELVAVICSGTNVPNMLDTTAADLASRLGNPDIEWSDEVIFDLFKIWLCNSFVKISGYDVIGAKLVHHATVSYTTKSMLKVTMQSFAINWTRRQNMPMSTGTAWEAWKAYTVDAKSVSRSEYQMIQVMEDQLCKIDDSQLCLLFVNIQELGWHDFLRRCLRSFHLAHVFEIQRYRTETLLSKAIDVGCDEIGKCVVLMTAAIDREVSIEPLLTMLDICISDFKDVWQSGFLDGALISAAKHRNDEWMCRSVINTLRQTKSSQGRLSIVHDIVGCHGVDHKLIPTPQADTLFASILSLNDDESYIRREYHCDYELVLVMDSLPQALKNAFKCSDSDAKGISLCRTLLEWSLSVFQNCESNLFGLSHVDIDAILRCCLKFGISNSQGELAALRSSCLKLVRSLLGLTHRPPCASLVDSSIFLRPATLWSMVLSHSKFTQALTPDVVGDKYWRHATEELINLLVCCVSQASDGMSIEKDKINALLIAYNGGTTTLDIAIRRLLSLIECMPGEFMPLGEQIAAFLISSSPIESGDSEFDFLYLDRALDIRRVHATLSQFPRCAYLSSLPLAFETWAIPRDAIDTAMIDEIEVDDDSAIGPGVVTAYDAGTCEQAIGKDDGGESPSSRDIWKGQGPDVRYDPSYIVPLIVAALESQVPEISSDEGDTAQGEDFARLAQRLCDKGGLSLCLASLCSACPSLRKLAFSGLCLFFLAFDSEAAKDLTTWRDRPQLKMLLTSVQVGFVLRKAMLASKGLGSEIPKLPSLSAIFLAKAALILSKPGDAMYSAMNKYFLKLSQNHGAYNDMTRLPAFIALFCSSSDENPEKERQWSLQCLRDSFLGGYGMVASCHAPQLLLTTLSRTRLDHTERLLILQVLTRLLQFGDNQATHHLLDRIGLLTWLKAYLVSDLLHEEVISAVLDLVEVAVEQGMKYVDDSQKYQLVLDLRNLLAPIAGIGSIRVCRVFCFIVRSLLELGYEETFSSAGLSVGHCLQLLNTSLDKNLMLEALCTSPLNQRDESTYPIYCETVLQNLLQLPDANVSLVLKRVCEVVRSCQSAGPWKKGLVRLILNLHSRAVRSPAYRDCLAACIAEVEEQPDSESVDESIPLAAKLVDLLVQ